MSKLKIQGNSQKKNAHLLFDSGSQRSYISKTLREELKLPTVRTEILIIKVFGNDRFKSEKVDIVSLILVGNEKFVTIKAICYPVICSELNNQNIFYAIGNYKHLQGLSLSDNTHHEKNQ